MSYSHMGKPHTTIGAIVFHFEFKGGIRWVHNGGHKQILKFKKANARPSNLIQVFGISLSPQNPLGVVWLSLTGAISTG